MNNNEKRRGRPPRDITKLSFTNRRKVIALRQMWRSYYYNCDETMAWARSAQNNSRRRASLKNVFHNLTTQQCKNLLPVDMMCPALGTKMTLNRGNRHISLSSPTIDRIDPDGPYTVENCHVISNLANKAKSHCSLAQLATLGKWAKRKLKQLSK